MGKIIVLDKCTLHFENDVRFDAFDRLGEVEFYDLLDSSEVIAVSKDAVAIFCNKTLITKEIMESCPKLRYIGIFATGYNNMDLEAAGKLGISVANVPSYSTSAVAQTVFSYILNFATSLDKYDTSTKNGDWIKSRTFSYFPFPITELEGKTLGIFGFGSIGRRVADIGNAFGMKVIVYTRTKKEAKGIRYVSKEALFSESDFLTIHCPLTPETENLICKDTLSLMKPTAFLINTARGGVVCENDLKEALENGVIKGAAVDVLRYEPMRSDCPLYSAKNITITPHVAWAAKETRQRLVDKAADSYRQFLSGNPINIVNKL